MSRIEGVIWCDGCGVEITWVPYRQPGMTKPVSKDYCCVDCYEGISCRCGERMEIDDERRDTPEINTSY